MTKIKICGITREEDAQACVELGADFLGLIFVPSSPRGVTPEQARRVVQSTSRRVDSSTTRRLEDSPAFVGVFRNESVQTMNAIADEVGLDYIQLHGDEPADMTLNRPTIKAFTMIDTLPDTTCSSDWLLFDSGGGTGRRFDWSLLASYDRTKPFLLAGGITPDNVAAAISFVRPDAIDVSSGVESAPGVKDHARLRSLFERVKR
jgi:phosphoribosylanthranilate isomerase